MKRAFVGGPPGVVIAHSPAASRQYIGSPSLAVLPGGEYLATHDLFGPGSTASTLGVTSVYRSDDRGENWRPLAGVEGSFWATLFLHRGDVYLMGTDRGDGRAVIRRSSDGGAEWSAPSYLTADAGYHCAPVPVTVHGGRLWRAMEDTRGPGGWGPQFRAFVMSADVDADLLDARSWRMSERLASDTRWLDGHFGGWLEGNVVSAPDGSLVIVLRVDYRLGTEKAAIVHVSEDGAKLSFDPQRDIVDFPGGCKKFTVRRDSQTGMYWSLTNHVPPQHLGGNAERTRNTVTLICSRDLRKWEIRDTVLYHPDVSRHGFCYLDWHFEGEDLIAVARTAGDDEQGGAASQHDANYLTFHRFPRFRQAEGTK